MRRTVIGAVIAAAATLYLAAPASAGLVSTVQTIAPVNTQLLLENSVIKAVCPAVPGQPAGTTLNSCGVAPAPGTGAACSHQETAYPFLFQELCRIQAAGALVECSDTLSTVDQYAWDRTLRCRAVAGSVTFDVSCTEDNGGYRDDWTRFSCRAWPLSYEDTTYTSPFGNPTYDTTRLEVGAIVLECEGTNTPIGTCKLV